MNKFKKVFASVALSLTVALTALTASASAYEVKKGDTMGQIAKAHEMSLQELSALNPQVKDINLIYVGDNINTEKSGLAAGQKTDKKPTVKVEKPVKSENKAQAVSQSEMDLLYRLVSAEAESEPYAGKMAVAQVVMNRVASDKFPDTVTGVIYQKRQFSPVTNGSINKKADAESIRAVNEVVSYYKGNPNGSMYFYNAKAVSSSWLDSLTTTMVIGNHTFKK